jgi:hypothetical protein
MAKWGLSSNAKSHILNLMLNRPPPYFPQSQLSPPDDNRYRKFKFVVAGLIVGILVLLTGLGVGIYYLLRWLF